MTPETALTQLRLLLEDVAPASGDSVPSERSLSAHLGCSRETLRSALYALEVEGEIWRRQGKGTFRGRAPAGQPVRNTILADTTTPMDVMEARVLLEPSVAVVACRRRTAADIALLKRRVEAGRNALDRPTSEQADDAFHQAVAQVARNPVLMSLLLYLSGARRRSSWQREWDRTYRRVGVGEFTGRHSDQHAAVVDAISVGDERAASEAMRLHLTEITQAMRGGQE